MKSYARQTFAAAGLAMLTVVGHYGALQRARAQTSGADRLVEVTADETPINAWGFRPLSKRCPPQYPPCEGPQPCAPTVPSCNAWGICTPHGPQ